MANEAVGMLGSGLLDYGLEGESPWFAKKGPHNVIVLHG